MQPKIIFLDALTLGKTDMKAQLSALGNYEEYENTSPCEVIEKSQGAQIILTNKVMLNREALASLKKDLKLICITATGMNNVDLEAAEEFGIVIKNVAGYSTKSVAQHTLMIALGLCARIPYYDEYVKSGQYAQDSLFTHLSFPLERLDGKRWGIIGLGAIGKEVAKLAQAFGAEVVYHSTSGQNYTIEYPQLSLKELLETSFVISVHAPLNEKTLHLLNKNNLPLIQDHGILINVGRGGIVHEEDLANELKKRPLYAGMDVFSQEPMEKNHPFLNPAISHQLLLTPHNAWGYEKSKAVLVEGVIANVKEFLQSK